MPKTATPRRAPAVLLAVLVIGPAVLATAPAPTERQARFEVRFLQDMIDHHSMAVMMGEMCLGKATHAELRELCRNIITTQMAEIRLMQSWLQSWYGIRYAPMMSRSGMHRLENLSGREFEIGFMEMMSEHHAQAIEESTRCLLTAFHKLMRDLCQNIITAQAAEINQMRTWLCEWYGECDPVKG